MLKDLEVRAVDAVVVVDQDRLTRHPRELEDFIILADRLGVPIANVAGEIDLSTSDGRFRARILGAVARQESEKKSERLRRQRDQHARQGRAHGGRRRYGYMHARDTHGNATLVVVPEEATRIREAAARFLAGESLRQIALSWNDQVIPTATGGAWQVTTLRTLLTGPHLAGLRVHRGDVVGEAEWPAILDRATWERIRAKIGDPRRARGGRPPAHLLTGLLECSKCGGTLHHSARADSGAGRYVCAPNAGQARCGKIAIAAAPIERIVSDAVIEALAVPELFAAIEAVDIDIEAVSRRIVIAEEALEQLARDFYAEQRISRREYLAAREELDRKLDDFRTRISAPIRNTVAALPSDVDGLRSLWDEATIEERRAIISTVVDRIVVSRGVPGRRKVDPDRVSILWRS